MLLFWLWAMFITGALTGYGLAVLKTWDCILESWKDRDIRLKLEGALHDVQYQLGWLDGHREIVRLLDASPWTWWVTRRKVVKQVLDEKERPS